MKRVGLLGGGQLGRMLALAGYPLGLRFRSLDPSPDTPAGHLTDLVIGRYDDLDALEKFSEGLELVTYEFENVPVSSARFLAERLPVLPPPDALEIAQDRLVEKNFFRKLGIPTPEFALVDDRRSLDEALEIVGLPAMLKTRRLGYDGKGQHLIREPAETDRVWESSGGSKLILERYVPFTRELSVLAVRGRAGDLGFYPLVENHHRDGILRLSLAPPRDAGAGLQPIAEEYATRVLQSLDYVGTLAIEFFEHEGRLLANEMAPRVHNSGHWTIEGAETSQFENHLRAILGYPLGSTRIVGYSAMVNIIGTVPDVHQVLAMPEAHLHLYDKEPRPKRKLGHITLWTQDRADLETQLALVMRLVDATR